MSSYIPPSTTKKAITAVKKLKIKSIEILDVLGYSNVIYISTGKKSDTIPKKIEKYTDDNPLINGDAYFGFGINENNYKDHQEDPEKYDFYLIANLTRDSRSGDSYYVTKTHDEIKEEIDEHASAAKSGKNQAAAIKKEIERFKKYVDDFDFVVLKPSVRENSESIVVTLRSNGSKSHSPKSKFQKSPRSSPQKSTPAKKKTSVVRKGKK